MKIVEEKKESAVVFSIEGRLDTSSSPEVEKKITDAIGSGATEIILDFSKLEYISSSGIRILIKCHKTLQKQNGHLSLVAVPKPIENILYITGFLPYFKIYEGQSQALEAARKS